MYHQGLRSNGPDPRRIIGAGQELLDQAVAIDPEFAARPHACWPVLHDVCQPRTEADTRGYPWPAAVHEALRIEPSLPEAHALRGVWAGGYDNYDWREAEQHWHVAMSGELVSCHVHFWYGHHYLLPLGRLHDALAQMKKGLEGDPINLLYRHHLAVGLRNVGRLDEAEAELRRVLELDEHFALAVGTLVPCARRRVIRRSSRIDERSHVLCRGPT